MSRTEAPSLRPVSTPATEPSRQVVSTDDRFRRELRRERVRHAFSGIAQVASAAIPGPGGAALGALGSLGDRSGTALDGARALQAEQQVQNMEYLALQQAMQDANRHFTTLSNLLRAQHETARAAIQNIRA